MRYEVKKKERITQGSSPKVALLEPNLYTLGSKWCICSLFFILLYIIAAPWGSIAIVGGSSSTPRIKNGVGNGRLLVDELNANGLAVENCINSDEFLVAKTRRHITEVDVVIWFLACGYISKCTVVSHQSNTINA